MSKYTPEEFDDAKTQVMKYILYKKRTVSEIRNKFCHNINEDMLDDIIEYLKEANYIDDKEYIEKAVNEYMRLKTISIREIKNRLYEKGIYADDIDDYISENREQLEEYERNSAQKIAQKKRGMDEKKLKNYLMSKGFGMDIVQEILNDKN